MKTGVTDRIVKLVYGEELHVQAIVFVDCATVYIRR